MSREIEPLRRWSKVMAKRATMHEDVMLCVRRRRAIRSQELQRLREIEAAAIEAYRAYIAIFGSGYWNERDGLAFTALYFALRDVL